MARKTRRTARARTKQVPQQQSQDKAKPVDLNPFEPIERLMQAWFSPWTVPAAARAAPKLDVIDRESSVLVRAEVPGVQRGNLAVEASDMAVTIKGEVAHEDTREGERYRISEMSHGTFERTVQLPADVDSTRAKATFKDGVVEVLLPKVDRSRAHHVKF
jgi:HSP20 family protein